MRSFACENSYVLCFPHFSFYSPTCSSAPYESPNCVLLSFPVCSFSIFLLEFEDLPQSANWLPLSHVMSKRTLEKISVGVSSFFPSTYQISLPEFKGSSFSSHPSGKWPRCCSSCSCSSRTPASRAPRSSGRSSVRRSRSRRSGCCTSAACRFGPSPWPRRSRPQTRRTRPRRPSEWCRCSPPKPMKLVSALQVTQD